MGLAVGAVAISLRRGAMFILLVGQRLLYTARVRRWLKGPTCLTAQEIMWLLKDAGAMPAEGILFRACGRCATRFDNKHIRSSLASRRSVSG